VDAQPSGKRVIKGYFYYKALIKNTHTVLEIVSDLEQVPRAMVNFSYHSILKK